MISLEGVTLDGGGEKRIQDFDTMLYINIMCVLEKIDSSRVRIEIWMSYVGMSTWERRVLRLFLLIQLWPSTPTTYAIHLMFSVIAVLRCCAPPLPFSIDLHNQEQCSFVFSASLDCHVDSSPSVPWLAIISAR